MTITRTLIIVSAFALGTPALAGPPKSKPGQATPPSKLRVKAKVKPKVSPRRAAAVDLRLGGGAILPWETPEQAGNNFAIALGATFDVFRLAIAMAGVLPDSRAEGLFFNLWLEFEWRFVRPWHHLQPYLVAGLGVAFPDAAEEPRVGDPVPLRWSEAHEFLGMLGVGVRYGRLRGLYVAFDLRAYNHTHGGFNLSAGYVF